MKKRSFFCKWALFLHPRERFSDSLGNEELLKSNVEKRAGNGITGEEASKSLPFDIDLHFFHNESEDFALSLVFK